MGRFLKVCYFKKVLKVTNLIPYSIKHNTMVKFRLYCSEVFISTLTPFFHLSQVVKLAAVSSGLPFVCTVYAATEKESKSQLVKPNQVRACHS